MVRTCRWDFGSVTPGKYSFEQTMIPLIRAKLLNFTLKPTSRETSTPAHRLPKSAPLIGSLLSSPSIFSSRHSLLTSPFPPPLLSCPLFFSPFFYFSCNVITSDPDPTRPRIPSVIPSRFRALTPPWRPLQHSLLLHLVQQIQQQPLQLEVGGADRHGDHESLHQLLWGGVRWRTARGVWGAERGVGSLTE